MRRIRRQRNSNRTIAYGYPVLHLSLVGIDNDQQVIRGIRHIEDLTIWTEH